MHSKIILFDGYCNLCSALVQFILCRDRKKVFNFASLQGVYGQKILSEHELPLSTFDTFILVDGDHIYTRSTGILKIVKDLPGAWPLLYPAILIPVYFRDKIYDFIARNRYSWFGKKTECWMPQSKWMERFID